MNRKLILFCDILQTAKVLNQNFSKNFLENIEKSENKVITNCCRRQYVYIVGYQCCYFAKTAFIPWSHFVHFMNMSRFKLYYKVENFYEIYLTNICSVLTQFFFCEYTAQRISKGFCRF